MENIPHIVDLLRKYLREDLSESERRFLQQWADSAPEYQRYLESLTENDRIPHDLKRVAARWNEEGDALQERLERNVLSHLQRKRNNRPHYLRWISYAAAVATFLLASWFFLLDTRQKTLDNRLAAEAILPGRNRAILTLTDGTMIDLNESREGIVVSDDDITYNDGTILQLFSPKGLQEGQRDEGGRKAYTELLSLSTPKGGTYQVTLPDGSKVWLNANSILKYPVQFDDEERVVELEGEAYFEVRNSPHAIRRKHIPFRVMSEGQQVEVLGTEFNISAYADAPETATTLVNGLVQVSSFKAGSVSEHVTLKPGQQAIMESGKAVATRKVDTEQFTAWKNGRFYFKNTSFEELMKQIGRWYDVEVIYTDKIPQETFSGKMSRDLTLGSVLKLLNVSDVQVQVEAGNRLVVR